MGITMNEIKKICSEHVVIYSPLPIVSLLSMEVSHKENSHGHVHLKVIIEEAKEDVMRCSYKEEMVRICFLEHEKEVVLFYGKMERVELQKSGGLLIGEVYGISGTIVLDQEKKKRSFQNTSMTYQQITELVTEENRARFIWTEENSVIKNPLIQYEETDWEFMVRLASHFHTALTVGLTTGKADFWFGMRSGQKRNIADARVLESGFSGQYYSQGSYEDGYTRSRNLYMKVKNKELWEIGDYVLYEGYCYIVYQRELTFGQGELSFFYTLGTDRMLYKKKKYLKTLKGLRLNGTVKKTEQESVYIQLDMDQKKNADYAWPWVPETGNLVYCMPEVGTKVVLYLPTDKEEDGIAVHGIRENGGGGFYDNVQNREFLTMHGKKAGMYAEQILFEAKSGISSLTLDDSSGIQIKSEGGIQLVANQGVFVNGGEVSVTAPQSIVCQTNSSNIEICKNFNLYAPGGVKSKGVEEIAGAGEVKRDSAPAEKEPEHWQVSVAALSAVPAAEFTSLQKDSLIDMAACGAISRFGKGSSVLSMKEVMEGKKAEETTFPSAFQSMGSYTMKGAHPLPQTETVI